MVPGIEPVFASSLMLGLVQVQTPSQCQIQYFCFRFTCLSCFWKKHKKKMHKLFCFTAFKEDLWEEMRLLNPTLKRFLTSRETSPELFCTNSLGNRLCLHIYLLISNSCHDEFNVQFVIYLITKIVLQTF